MFLGQYEALFVMLVALLAHELEHRRSGNSETIVAPLARRLHTRSATYKALRGWHSLRSSIMVPMMGIRWPVHFRKAVGVFVSLRMPRIVAEVTGPLLQAQMP